MTYGKSWAALVALGLAAMTPGGAVAGERAVQPKEVHIKDGKFLVGGEEQPLTIRVGDTVVFVNDDDAMAHSAVGRGFDTQLIPPGERSKPIKFTRPGRVRYVCGPHPWMKGSIVVEERE
jgi:plastocyanin